MIYINKRIYHNIEISYAGQLITIHIRFYLLCLPRRQSANIHAHTQQSLSYQHQEQFRTHQIITDLQQPLPETSRNTLLRTHRSYLLPHLPHRQVLKCASPRADQGEVASEGGV